MKILLTTHQFFPQFSAGTEVLTLSVARELIKCGYTVHVFTGFPSTKVLADEGRFDEYDYEGIHVYRFHHAYTPMGGQTSMIEVGYDNKLAVIFFENILNTFKAELIHFFHFDRLGTGLIEHAVKNNIPCFFTPTDFWSICPTGQLLINKKTTCSGPNVHAGNCIKHLAMNDKSHSVGFIAKCIPLTVFNIISELTKRKKLPKYPHCEEVNATGGRLAMNISRLKKLSGIISPTQLMTKNLIQNGVPAALIVQSSFGINIDNRKIQYAPQRPLRVGFIGTIASHKGAHILIKAFSSLPVNSATLKIYGNMKEDVKYADNLRDLALNQSNIDFCGVFENSKISTVLEGIDVLVVPSLWFENTPLVIFSAQAVHCPVIASDFPGISEVIHNEVNGLLFEPGNSTALAEKIRQLIEVPSLIEQLSANALKPKSIEMYVDDLLGIWKGDLLAQ